MVPSSCLKVKEGLIAINPKQISNLILGSVINKKYK